MVSRADPPARPPVPAAVLGVLADAQVQGFIGPGPLAPHVVHAHGFADALARARGTVISRDDHVVDLGAGGGLPGLVLAVDWPEATLSLVEGSVRRSVFLEEAVGRCGLGGRVAVVAERAELAGRREELRGRCSIVVARSFGRPGETAECGSPFLCPGGLLIVSEPPEARAGAAWPPGGLAMLGLERLVGDPGGARFVVFRQVEACPDRYPRRIGVPRKRPLF